MNFEYNAIRQCARLRNSTSVTSCHCIEDSVYEWTWNKENNTRTIILSENNLKVKFHNTCSFGTAVVRGTNVLEKGRLHYWEVQMLSYTYGTDIMVGVGTSNVNIISAERKFCSFLGHDQESFGFSYHGFIQHAGKKRDYGACFGEGNLVGVYLDTWRGTLEFFLNRKPLGIAFTGLKDFALYPMMCSTAAHSIMRLTYSCSMPASLSVSCLSVLKSSHRAYLSTMVPGLRYLTQSIFADILRSHSNRDDENEKDEVEFLTDRVSLDDFALEDIGIKGIKRKKMCR